ncbi:MAG: hypothetical protein FJY67_07670 [Calditrichaeota bacterium]|nr:hypothetical protein [Calditrichota bacterium]
MSNPSTATKPKALWENAVDILREKKSPMTKSELWNEIKSRGLYTGEGLTPWQTLSSGILWHCANVESTRKFELVFYRVASRYGLLEWLEQNKEEIFGTYVPITASDTELDKFITEMRVNIENAVIDFIDRIIKSDKKGEGFQSLCAIALKTMGYQEVTVNGKGGDRGIDLIAEYRSGPIVTVAIAQCKGHKRPIGPDVVRELNGTSEKDMSIHSRIFFSANGFTKAALEEAEKCGINVIDKKALANLFVNYGVKA